MDARKQEQRVIVTKSARMVQQLEDGDPLPPLRVVRQLRDIFADVVIEPQLTFFFEKKNARGRELFRNRTDVKDSLRRNRHISFDVCEAVSLGVDDLAIAVHTERAARRSRFCQISKDRIYLGIGILRGTSDACGEENSGHKEWMNQRCSAHRQHSWPHAPEVYCSRHMPSSQAISMSVSQFV